MAITSSSSRMETKEALRKDCREVSCSTGVHTCFSAEPVALKEYDKNKRLIEQGSGLLCALG